MAQANITIIASRPGNIADRLVTVLLVQETEDIFLTEWKVLVRFPGY